jgi:hypothetical protein
MMDGTTALHTSRSTGQAKSKITGFYFPNNANLLLITNAAVEYYSVRTFIPLVTPDFRLITELRSWPGLRPGLS